MATTWHGALVVGMASAGMPVEEGAPRLLDEGVGPEQLAEIDAFVRQLALDPTIRDRAMLLLETTRLLAARASRGAQASDGLQADAKLARVADRPMSNDRGGAVWRHELSTPLAVAGMALETLAARRDDPATVQKMLEVARRNLRLADHLVSSLATVEDLEAGRISLSWARVDLVEVVRTCVDDVGALLAGEHAIQVRVEQAVTLPADRDAVHQIVTNLLSNAAKFSPEGTTIHVTVSATADHGDVAVTDHGPGLSPHQVQRIFHAGERLDVTAPGMGLGLFIARTLARAHGGDLHVEHPSAGGARFVLRLLTSPAVWQGSLERREVAVTARDATQRDRSATADRRDAALAEREVTADQRDATLIEREATADQRDAELDRRDSS